MFETKKIDTAFNGISREKFISKDAGQSDMAELESLQSLSSLLRAEAAPDPREHQRHQLDGVRKNKRH